MPLSLRVSQSATLPAPRRARPGCISADISFTHAPLSSPSGQIINLGSSPLSLSHLFASVQVPGVSSRSPTWHFFSLSLGLSWLTTSRSESRTSVLRKRGTDATFPHEREGKELGMREQPFFGRSRPEFLKVENRSWPVRKTARTKSLTIAQQLDVSTFRAAPSLPLYSEAIRRLNRDENSRVLFYTFYYLPSEIQRPLISNCVLSRIQFVIKKSFLNACGLIPFSRMCT